MGWFETWLRRRVPFKEIGWTEIGEKFTRYALWRTRWFNVYLHQLYAPNWHPQCHDHPWGFVAVLIKARLPRRDCPQSEASKAGLHSVPACDVHSQCHHALRYVLVCDIHDTEEQRLGIQTLLAPEAGRRNERRWRGLEKRRQRGDQCLKSSR